METNAALVRTNGIVVLHAITHVGLHVALVVNPCHTECDDTIWNTKTINKIGAVEFRMTVVLLLDSTENLAYGLNILRLVGEALLKALYCFNCIHSFMVFKFYP